MTEAPSIQWFPGHMTKTKRMIEKCLPMVDAVVEVIDARIPLSSRNPVLDSLIGGKPRIIVLNKCDAADESANRRWIEYFRSCGAAAIAADCKTGRGLNAFSGAVREVLAELIAKNNAKGMSGRILRLMVVGIPNVGKSSLINKLAGRNKAKVEDRPGVTRDKQWVRLANDIDLLDMPGVLWPKFEDKLVGERLAFTGAVKDDIMDTELLACRLLLCLREYSPGRLSERYHIDLETEKCEDMPSGSEGYELLLRVGKARGMLVSGGEINTERAAITVLDEFRSGKIGRITLELPPKS